MLIYSHIITSRTSYIFHLLLQQMMSIHIELTDNLDAFNESDSPKLVYGKHRISDNLFIESNGLLFEKGVREMEIDCFDYKNEKAFFAGSGDLPFDIFAASFYLISRYEEYLPSVKDQYGRFQAKNSLGYNQHFHHKPIINIWVDELKQLIQSRYPKLTCTSPVFKATMSYDIDVAYAFKGRTASTTVLSASRDLLSFRFQHLQERLNVLTDKIPDPFDSYEYIRSSLQSTTADHLFFFLLKKDRTQFDRNISPGSASLQQLIKSIAAFSDTGLHPSYFSSENPSFLVEEKKILEALLASPVTKSRQHYLRFELPGTFLNLIAAGITDDYSMGYAELPGFRAGISTPFPFYNLLKEEATSLTIHPVSYMDGSFIEDLKLTPEESLEHIKLIVNEIKKVNGHLLCIWHNHTLSDKGIYKGWRKPYEETLRLINDN